mmetsp:Transcript_80719/g.224673  ORF Transcript_80719/g.224673 Transcript_80719/m.224673 type:complete len:299 (+) Transcript_80719:249-1145(+)
MRPPTATGGSSLTLRRSPCRRCRTGAVRLRRIGPPAGVRPLPQAPTPLWAGRSTQGSMPEPRPLRGLRCYTRTVSTPTMQWTLVAATPRHSGARLTAASTDGQDPRRPPLRPCHLAGLRPRAEAEALAEAIGESPPLARRLPTAPPRRLLRLVAFPWKLQTDSPSPASTTVMELRCCRRPCRLSTRWQQPSSCCGKVPASSACSGSRGRSSIASTKRIGRSGGSSSVATRRAWWAAFPSAAEGVVRALRRAGCADAAPPPPREAAVPRHPYLARTQALRVRRRALRGQHLRNRGLQRR